MEGAQKAAVAETGGGAPPPVRARRPVKPVSVAALSPVLVPSAQPRFEWVDPATLLVDETYQRGLSDRSMKLVRKIIAGFDWRRFKPPVCAQTEGGLEVIDGQHTAIAAASHPAVDLIPVMIVDGVEQSDRAGAFIGHNRDRLNITPMQMHFAAAAAGDEDAQTIAQVCERAGVIILKSTPANGVFKPRTTVAVQAIGALINRRTALKARQALQVLAEADLSPINALHIKAAELLLFDKEYAGEIEAEGITNALLALGSEAEQEAGVFAATHNIPKWRALAIVLFKKGRRRGRRSAD